jgi:hypothetical protein
MPAAIKVHARILRAPILKRSPIFNEITTLNFSSNDAVKLLALIRPGKVAAGLGIERTASEHPEQPLRQFVAMQ